jgi:thioredoxin 1
MKSVLLLITLLLASAPAAAEPFTEAAFREAQQQNALILVDVHASWCPTCARQGDVLDAWFEARHESGFRHTETVGHALPRARPVDVDSVPWR